VGWQRRKIRSKSSEKNKSGGSDKGFGVNFQDVEDKTQSETASTPMLSGAFTDKKKKGSDSDSSTGKKQEDSRLGGSPSLEKEPKVEAGRGVLLRQKKEIGGPIHYFGNEP